MSIDTLTDISLAEFVGNRELFLRTMQSVADGNDCDITLHEGGNKSVAKLTANSDRIMPAASWKVTDETLDLRTAFRLSHANGDILSFTQTGKADVLLIPATNKNFN